MKFVFYFAGVLLFWTMLIGAAGMSNDAEPKEIVETILAFTAATFPIIFVVN